MVCPGSTQTRSVQLECRNNHREQIAPKGPVRPLSSYTRGTHLQHFAILPKGRLIKPTVGESTIIPIEINGSAPD